MLPTVAVFTDTYLPTVNGVTYTIRAWRECWERRGGRMDVVYPGADGHDADEREHPVRSVAFPFYEGFHVGLPGVPDAVLGSDDGFGIAERSALDEWLGGIVGSVGSERPGEGGAVGANGGRVGSERPGEGGAVGANGGSGASDAIGVGTAADVVHAHTPFLLGLSGRWCADALDAPLVASYHTPTAEYADYLANGTMSRVVEGVARRYERWFMNSADAVVVPSEPARAHLRSVGVRSPIEIVPNGVDLETFRPVDAESFRERHGLPDGPLVGYTGRHGYEKNLQELLAAADGLEGGPTVVLAGDGPARDDLEARADQLDADVRFLGFLDRDELPALYSALDVFAFPSPVETQGLVALEATACGTPVVGANEGALSETVLDGETGYNYEAGDPADFRAKIDRTLAEREELGESCLARREELSVEHAVDRLAEVYEHLLQR